jgi:hypothetical protein
VGVVLEEAVGEEDVVLGLLSGNYRTAWEIGRREVVAEVAGLAVEVVGAETVLLSP